MTSNVSVSPSDKGILIVLSGPSGVGKGTVCKALRACAPDIVYSVSATTRSPREGEVDGVNYFFQVEGTLSAVDRTGPNAGMGRVRR